MAESPVIRYLAIEKKSFSFWFISTNVNSDIVDLYSIVQVTNNNQLTSNYPSQPGWDDGMATFEMTIVANNLHGDYQLANGLGPDQAMVVLTEHRKNFITGKDFYFLSKNGINAVRIPVGWWIAYDPNPPAPFVSGSLDTLDRAFYWAQ
jgi:aryl-phospho-beta-D-glucosidase BglC (GH1 family)